MKMTLETGPLTERDRKLIRIVGTVLVLCVLIFLIGRPLYRAIIALDADIASASAEKQEAEQEVSLLQSQQTINGKLREEYTAGGQEFYSIMESQDIDRLLTTEAVSHGLGARSLAITMPQGMTTVAPYQYSSEAESAGASGPVIQDTASGVYTAAASMTLTGSHEALQQLIDDFYTEDYHAIRITGYTWGGAADETAVSAVSGVAAEETLSLNLEIYMCTDIDTTLANASAASASSAFAASESAAASNAG